ncbi:MAG: RIP metalloprotease RseP [Firmicutes bacterium]|nr:RIP metalloprotease RseP [Bacillota bacterium]
MSIVYTLIILCVLVVVHEFGHFAVAKLNGIKVHEFAIGMGPQVISRVKGDTRYSLRLFPIGGFVAMEGEDEDSDDAQAFCNKSVAARMAVTFAGPAMNFIFAAIFFMVAFMYFGQPSTNGLLGEVSEGSPAALAGLQAGDVIVSLDDEQVENWDDISLFMQDVTAGDTVQIGYMRDGELYAVSVPTGLNEETGSAVLGVRQGVERTGLWDALKNGCVMTVNFTVMLVVSLWQMITGAAAVDVAGPVGMVSMVGEFADVGLIYLFLFAGILSVNLGVMNLLPIPALDGSRLVFLAIEGIRRKPIDRDKEAMVHLVGFVLLMMLMGVVTYLDIERLLQ